MIFKEYLIEKYNKETQELFLENFETKRYSKEHILTNYDEVEKYCYFIENGVVEAEISNDKNEFLIDILFEGEICTSFISFYSGLPSDILLRCTSDTILTKIPLHFIKSSNNPLIVNFLLNESMRYTMKRVQREKDFFILSTKERYLKILKNNQELINRIPLYKLAKYLKVSPERLSRIRKEIS
jgi:signal-transduction protein with cAMP-binding, CBS, and nucleotidyltransferase domain